MSGAISQLGSLFTAAGGGDGLLQALYGIGTSTGTKAGNPVLALNQAERNQTRDVARTAARSDVARDIAAFRAGLARATTPAAALADKAVMKVLMTANGLGDQIGSTALAKKALLSDVSDSNSLVNKLSDTRWKATAKTYDFARQGLARLKDPKVLATLESGYAEVSWRQGLDKTTPGLSDALTFRAQAGKMTSALDILGDPVLRRVVTTTLGLPLQIAFQSVEAQEKAVSTRLDVTKLQDPKFVEKFAQRYLITRANTPDTTNTNANDLTTLAGKSAGLIV